MTGLVGWWPFHENSGDTARDLSGRGNHGTLNGGITQGVAGKAGLTAYSFNGADSNVQASGRIIPRSSDFTISGWVKQADMSTDDAWISASKTDGEAFIFYSNTSYGSADNNIRVVAPDEVLIGPDIRGEGWKHLTLRRDGSTYTLFVDGEEEATGSETAPIAEDIALGHYMGDGNDTHYMNGQISNARIYNRALSPEEVQTLYEWGDGDYASPPGSRASTVYTPSAGVAYYPLDGDASDVWNSNDGALNGTSFTGDAVRGQAASFNGSSNYIDLNGSLYPQEAKTLATWFKYSEGGLAAGDAYLFEQEGEKGNLQSLYYNDDTEIKFRNNGEDTITYSVNISPGTWNFVAYTYDGSTEKLFLNGALVATGNNGYDTDNANNTGLGTKRLGDGLWEGKMDDSRIYSRALSPSEVFQLYQWGTRGRDLRKLTVNSRGL